MEIILRLLLAAGLSAAIGYQRERAGKAAGLRTHILIALGAALFTVVSIFGFNGAVDPSRVAAGVVAGVGFIGAVDPSRVAAGVVAGVGFIGAGVIFRGMRGEEGGVAGLTSASCIWITAAIGLAAGAGMYLISAIATAITVGVLWLPKIRG